MEWTPKGETNGVFVVCALLRGHSARALRHRFEEIKDTEWGMIAAAITGATNGNVSDRLLGALKNMRYAGHTEEETRHQILATIARYDGLTDDWLQQDPEYLRRRGAPRKTCKEVAAMIGDTEWLWRGWIPKGYLSMLCGRPGAGKSFVAAWIAANTIQNGSFPDGTHTTQDPTAKVMWIDTEGTQQLLVQRLKMMGAPLDRFFWPLDPKNAQEDYPQINLADERWISICVDMIIEERPCWIVVDSLRGAFPGDENSSELQVMLSRLAAVARDLGSAFTLVHHLRKANLGEITNEVTLEQVRGSSAIVAMMRTVIAMDKPDLMATTERLRVIKSNLAKFPLPVGVEIREDGPVSCDAPTIERPMSATQRGVEFLRSRLQDGPMASHELDEEARANGISKRSLRTAKEVLGVVAVKIEGHWEWAMPARSSQQEPEWMKERSA